MSTTKRARLIMKAISKEFEVPRKLLLSESRGAPHVAEARQALMFFLVRDAGMTLTRVGELLGRTRRTVSHGVRATEDRAQYGYPSFVEKMMRVKGELG